MQSQTFRRKTLARSVALALAASSFVFVGDAGARVTKIVLDPIVPAFGGAVIPNVGTYDRITGWAYGELNPNDPLNQVIVDVQNAPRNAKGNVEYSFNFYILAPHDKSNSAHRAMYEPPNRGGKSSGSFLRLAGGNDPGTTSTAAQAEAGFLTTRGWTMMYSGWDFAAGQITTDPYKAVINLPVAHNKNGSSITGPSFEYFTGNGGTALPINYVPANPADKVTAVLTHRVHLDDAAVVVPSSQWDYDAAGKNVVLNTGTYVSQDIYEFSYTAKDPTVNGVGFAAVRDFNSFMKYAKADDFGTPNPVAGDIKKTYTYIVSQPGRMLNDFRHLGMNEDESHRKVLDGIVNWISAGDGINMNLRFSQPGRTERNRQDHLFAEGVFPFSNFLTFDPITKSIDSRYLRCTLTGTCALGMEIYSANEYWVKAASLLHTTPDGKFDLPDWPEARNYFISSHQHGTGNGGSRGSCQQFQNPLDSTPIHRALMIAMDAWATSGTAPPPSAIPHLFDGSMTTPANVGFPTNIPNPFWTGSTVTGTGITHDEPNQYVMYTGLKTTRYRYNYGPRFDQGIMDIDPPIHFTPYEDNPANGPIYPSYAPKVDSDGNDVAGIRMAEVQVPVATYTGWALRAGPQANDGCEGSGQWVRFPATEAARTASGDPRPSNQARYGTDANYKAKFSAALDGLVARRLLLPEDEAAALAKAPPSNIP